MSIGRLRHNRGEKRGRGVGNEYDIKSPSSLKEVEETDSQVTLG